MTKQVLDRVIYEERSFSLAAVSKPLPIELQHVPVGLARSCTGCWRGCQCVFGIREDRLYLDEFWNYTGMEVNMVPLIHGRKPNVDMSRWRKSGVLGLKVPYTGCMLVGNKLAPGWRDYGLVPHPFGYVEAIEFVFRRGKLIDSADRSGPLGEIRLYLRKSKPRTREKRYLEWLELRDSLDMWAWFRGKKRS